MAITWVPQRGGQFDLPSNNASSPWYDGGTQTGYASCPITYAASDIWSTGAYALTAPAAAVGTPGTPTGQGTISAGGSLTLGAYPFACGPLTCATTGALTTGAGQVNVNGAWAGGSGAISIGSGGLVYGANSTLGTGAVICAPGGYGSGLTASVPTGANPTITFSGNGLTAWHAQHPTSNQICLFDASTLGIGGSAPSASGVVYGFYPFAYVSDTTITVTGTPNGGSTNPVTGVGFCLPSGYIQGNANSALTLTGVAGSSLTLNGTGWAPGNFGLITNINTGASATLQLKDMPTINGNYSDVLKGPSKAILITNVAIASWVFNNLNLKPSGSAANIGIEVDAANGGPFQVNNSYISNASKGIVSFACRGILNSVTWGIDRFGITAANTNDLGAGTAGSYGIFEGHGTRLTASTPFSEVGLVTFTDDNYGCANGYTPAAGRGVGKYYESKRGGILRNTTVANLPATNPTTGSAYTHDAQFTPLTTTSATVTLPMQFEFPIKSGDTAVFSIYALAATGSACLKCTIDPENVYGMYATATETLTTGYQQFTLAGGAAAGGTGKVRVLCECIVPSGTTATMDVGAGQFVATHSDTTTLTEYVSFDYWWQGQPEVDPPIAITLSHLEASDLCNSGTGTLDLSTYTLKSGVVDASYVLTGHSNYSGGSAGSLTLPALDHVLISAGNWGVGGSGSTGTFDSTLYALISGIVSAANVRNGTARYIGGTNGTAYIPAASDVRHAVNVDATTGSAYIPSAADVRHGTNVDATTGTAYIPAASDTRFSVNVDATAGTCKVPAKAAVELGVAVDVSDTGTYNPMAAAVFPAIGKVDSTASAYGPTGAEYNGTLNVAGLEATYYANGQAAQLATDQGAVNLSKGNILSTATILSVTGTFDLVAWEAGRNTDPDIANVRSLMPYKIHDVDLVGIYAGGGGGTPPAAPTLAVANDGTGTSATATLAGDVGATHQLFYQATGTSAWIAGASRSGNGGVDQTGLVAGQLYYFAAVSQIGGVLSLPSPIFALAVQTAVTVVGQTDALALAVVSWLTDNADAFCIPIVAERRFRLISELSEIPAANAYASVDVFPDMETNDRLGIAPAFTSLYTIHIFIQQQVGGSPGPEAQCALLTQLRSQILAGLKPLLFNLADAVQPVQNVFLSQARSADKGLYNLGRLLELNVYESDTILTFKAAV